MDNQNDEIVELHPAHMWDCPECGRENFCRGIVNEMTYEDKKKALAEYYNINEEDLTEEEVKNGQFVSAPISVACKFCECEFRSKEQRD